MTTEIRVVGLDVCKDRVVCCLLTVLPDDPQEFYQDSAMQEFGLNWDGFNGLMAIKPTIAVYEPTGIAYSRVWVERLRLAGVQTYAVDHSKLRAYRKGLGLPDKDDFADALALACYWLDPLKQGRFSFVRNKEKTITDIRSLVLRLQHLDRRKSPIINRLKQDLAIAFPEAANRSCDDAPLFWGWLAGERASKRYDKMANASIGLGVKPETIAEAKALTACFREEQDIERRLRAMTRGDRRFAPYLKVFAEFGFGDRASALLLSQIFPFEDFLKDGAPEVKIRKGKHSGKPTARHLSLRRFQKAIGVAPVKEQSGDKTSSRKGGSALCRKALWQWCFTRIEVRNQTSNSTILEIRKIHQSALQRHSNTDEAKGVRVKLARAYTRRKVSIMLFKRLVEATW